LSLDVDKPELAAKKRILLEKRLMHIGGDVALLPAGSESE
jgi:hypothetical protein